MDALKLAQLNERRADQEEQMLELVSQILDELELRLIDFSEQAAEKIFKAYPDISGQFDRHRVKQFKREMQETSRDAIGRLIGFLADEDLWLKETPSRRPKESLRQNLKVWEAIQSFPRAMIPILKRYGYPARSSVLEFPYRELELKEVDQLPKPEALKLLTLKYWIALGKFQQTVMDSQRLQQTVAHQSLEEIWQD
ncbi:hypothetical protein COW36_05060 [bacterium (Candidatus Blackallbacteria) CG17_big_fil_post_rev_8_21_14_2_50_48_46]|uniref:Uncharacterized protein n=1 Tax=bacterium (Candidatus Blackallbacteria) CG17_big_fil_post_rev_8_21_14_2_50_48_46 TaxID=2014261 RepID=A0A2M7G977_9BACT|nr:MAG: hypothetical protein COW64_03885 [bacterium (Candidatus Blackallbacteria) CG18_big_fil_WC_8_21_14_2_50_49_26]PIW18666.1 MAG: hypothetical protein COW36_05060 [bacterium (Candidatus Blackallbacteria) CG17_big_fil_post_rev_8_21_14_2_50_48_46]PIW46348.1 MAG: hypothetical protein COW20_15620 [bacterium (Candidatus Blackallbacteria) CG13_big_fil_rev_8_21_14_2_50_49_14]